MKRKKQKGQVAIEFMLLIVIVLLYIQTILQPAIFESSNSLNDSTKIAEAVFAGKKLANEIDFIASSSGAAKTTITLFLPSDTNIYCNATFDAIQIDIGTDSKLDISTATGATCDPTDKKCYKSIELFQSLANCNMDAEHPMQSRENPNKVMIEKKEDGTIEVTKV